MRIAILVAAIALIASPSLADQAPASPPAPENPPSVCLTLDELNRIIAAQIATARAQDSAAAAMAKVRAAFPPPPKEPAAGR